MSTSNDAATKPPYVSYSRFWAYINELAEHHPPPQYLLEDKSGPGDSELRTALRFFGLIDGDGRATQSLRMLVTKPTPTAMRPLIEQQYGPVIALNLRTATTRQVEETLRSMGATDGVIAKALTFFVHAAQNAGFEVGHSLSTRRPPATAPSRRRATQVKARQRTQIASEETPAHSDGRPQLIDGLVALLPKDAQSWTAKKAEQWLKVARETFAMVYEFTYDDEPVGSPS
jgi:hypothetical protein